MANKETYALESIRTPSIQNQLDELFALSNEVGRDGIANLPGFSVALHASEFGYDITCFQYVLGQRSAQVMTAVVNLIIQDGTAIRLEDIDRGHVVFYSPGGVITSIEDVRHVAVGVGPGVVQSIFGNWTHVYKHPYEYVPGKYGGNIAAFIKPRGVILNAGLHGIV